ncbi:MAG TPA: cell division protein FtsA [Fimbriimonadaceae bacterium]|nr:cell division protein FtsA [Fimbriimonadaceae bacterium]
MKEEFVSVLDLGSTKAVCLAVSRADEGLRVLAMANVECRGVRRGVVADLEHTATAADSAIRKVQTILERDIESVVLGIGGQHIEGTLSQGFVPIYPRSRSITRDDVFQVINHSRQMLLPPDREQVQALPREFRVDGERGIVRPVGMNGSKLEVVTYIATGQSTHIQNLERAVGMAGKKVEMMVLQPLASGLSVVSKEEMEMGCAVVDIGGGTTDVAVFSGGSIAYSSCIPVGGQLVTSDLSKLLKASPEEAERLKQQSGAVLSTVVEAAETVDVMQLGQTHTRPMQRRVLCEIIESRMNEIAVIVRQQIERSGYNGMLPGGIVLTGGGSKMPGTEELFGKVLQHTRVRSGAPALGGELSSAVDRAEMATAVGLAQFALSSSGEELGSVNGTGSWKNRIRTLWSVLSGKG